MSERSVLSERIERMKVIVGQMEPEALQKLAAGVGFEIVSAMLQATGGELLTPTTSEEERIVNIIKDAMGAVDDFPMDTNAFELMAVLIDENRERTGY